MDRLNTKTDNLLIKVFLESTGLYYTISTKKSHYHLDLKHNQHSWPITEGYFKDCRTSDLKKIQKYFKMLFPNKEPEYLHESAQAEEEFDKIFFKDVFTDFEKMLA